MSSFLTNPPFLGPLPYHLASAECQLNAQRHVQKLLQGRFPTLTESDWYHLLVKCRPLLRVDEAARTVAVADEAMPDLVSRAAAYEATGQHVLPPRPPVGEERYLAKQLAYYCRLANRLVATDPELTHPDSITDMRNVFFRLEGGNSVAERLSEPLVKLSTE